MATDATGTPTSLGIPKFNVNADAPSGLGGNAQMDSIDALIKNLGISGLVANDVPVYDTVTGKFIKATGTPSSTTYLRGDGSWATPAGALTLINSWTAPGGVYYDTNTVLGGNIPQTYKDLILTVTGNTTDVSDRSLYCQVNGVSTANYQWSGVQANGSTVVTTGGGASVDRITLGTIARTGSIASSFDMVLNDYVASTVGWMLQSNWAWSTNFGTANVMTTGRNAGYSTTPAPITRILLFPDTGFIKAGSIVKLYGRG